MSPVPRITLDDLIDRYSVILFDAYGVLAGSKSVVPRAPEAIDRLNDLGMPYYVLTNDASALPETTAARYARMRLRIDVARIITSGSLLTRHFKESGLTGSRCVVLGTDDSVRYVDAAGGDVVSYAQEFDTLILGDQSWPHFLDTANGVLTALFNKIDKDHRVNLVLPNPDLIYPDGNGFGFASGTAAMMFESALALRYPGRSDLSFHPARQAARGDFRGGLQALWNDGYGDDRRHAGDRHQGRERLWDRVSASGDRRRGGGRVAASQALDRPDCRMRSLALRS